MSRQCDKCVTNLPWHFDSKTSYLTTEQSLQAFSLSSFVSALEGFLRVVGAPGLKSTKVPIVNLCDKCWTTTAGGWCANGGEVYKTIPAKTASDAIYMRNAAPEYLAGGKTNLPAVQSTLVHEGMHFLSADHKGLQD